MRRERSFLMLLVLGIALGAYIYFVERKRPAGDEAEQKPKVFDTLEADKIEELTISSGGERTHLKKTGGKWQIVESVAVDADQTEVSGITSSLAGLERIEVADEDPASLKEFGLDPPQADVRFRAQGSGSTRQLLVGNKAPTGDGLYAKLAAEKRVFLIPSYLESSFARKTFDLRDKSVLKFDRDKVDTVDIQAAGHAVALVHSPSEWRITSPLKVRADFGAAESIVGRLATAQMKSLVSTGAPDAAALKKYGLETPTASVTIGTGSSRASLRIGSADPEGNYYAQDASRPLVFTVEASLVDELKKPVGDLRRKDVFEFRPFNATHVEVTRNGQTHVFAKMKGSDPKVPTTEKWRQSAPKARDVELSKMDAMLSSFSNLRAESWAEKTDGLALERPDVTFLVKFDEGKKQERLTFSKQGNDIYVSRADEPGAAKISSTDYGSAVRALDDLLK